MRKIAFSAPVLFRRSSLRTVLWRALACLLPLCALPAAQAQAPAQQNLEQFTQQWIEQALQSNPAAASSVLRMEVEVGALDPRLRLAPCERVEPYLPTGTRLWGRTRLGLRCVAGQARWNVFLPITVKAYGPAWVLTGNVALGATLSQADAMQSEVDWAAEYASVVADPAQWVGQVAARPLQAGQTLRQSMVKAPRLFQAGAQVRVVSQGPGFAVSAAGQALVAGAAGETVRVRMANGKTVSGVVSEAGTVDVTL